MIFDPEALAGRKLDRRDLHLIDWDGDGACDIVWTDPENGNRVQLWRNRYPETNSWLWDFDANPAPSIFCAQQKGLGLYDGKYSNRPT